jgi:hypothetical protein
MSPADWIHRYVSQQEFLYGSLEWRPGASTIFELDREGELIDDLQVLIERTVTIFYYNNNRYDDWKRRWEAAAK